MKTSCYVPRRIVRANHNESFVRPSEMHLTLISRKCEVYITPEVKDYAIPVVSKNSLTNFSSISNLTLIVNKYSDIISSKIKVVKFI